MDKPNIRKSIEELLNEEEAPIMNPNGTLPAFQLNDAVDYDDMKASSVNKSKKMMHSLLKFYLTEEVISKNEYIQAKAKLDTMTLANLIQQMQISERAITTIMRSIDSGEFSPRMFEVLGGLQKTMLDIMKHQTLHMMAAEENMKKLKRDIDVYSLGTPEIKSIPSSSSGNTTRGTRNLMRDIQAELGNREEEEEIDPLDFDSENQTDL